MSSPPTSTSSEFFFLSISLDLELLPLHYYKTPFAGALYGTYEAFRYKVRNKTREREKRGGAVFVDDELRENERKKTHIPSSLSLYLLFLPLEPHLNSGPRNVQDPLCGPDHAVLGCRVRALSGRRELAALRAGAGVKNQFFFGF